MSDNDEFRRAQSLYRRGLAQGKNGEPYRAVHTPEGLRVWREMIASAE